MTGEKLLIVLFLSTILVFGCTSAETKPQQNQTQQTGTGTGSTGTGTGTSGTGTQDLSGLAYSELLKLGIPIECDVTSTYQGQSSKMKTYIKTEKELRIEYTSPQSTDCPKGNVIVLGDTTYFACEGKKFMGTDCDWCKVKANESDTSGTTGTSTGPSASDFKDLPSTSFNCKPWIYDSTKFTTSGKVCTMEDLMKGYTQ
jgi:hypothetical protein